MLSNDVAGHQPDEHIGEPAKDPGDRICSCRKLLRRNPAECEDGEQMNEMRERERDAEVAAIAQLPAGPGVRPEVTNRRRGKRQREQNKRAARSGSNDAANALDGCAPAIIASMVTTRISATATAPTIDQPSQASLTCCPYPAPLITNSRAGPVCAAVSHHTRFTGRCALVDRQSMARRQLPTLQLCHCNEAGLTWRGHDVTMEGRCGPFLSDTGPW